MSRPLVTVVVTTRDRPVLAARAVRSALNQTMRDLEVIAVDDASSEGFVAQSDDRVRAIRRDQSTGVCGARNAGLHEARGSWITFLDDDDELVPEMVELSLGAADRSELPRPVSVLSGLAVIDQA